MKKRNKVFIGVTVLILLVTFIVLFIVLKQKKKNSTNDRVVIGFNNSYTNDGIIYYIDSRIRFADALSHNNVILCDKPNCLHERASSTNPNPTCNAVINGGKGSAVAIHNGKLYFVDGESLFDKYVYKADVNGANRKKIAFLSNIQDSSAAYYSNQYLIYSYKNQYELEADILMPLDEPVVGVIIINLDTSKVTYIPDKSGYYAQVYKVHYYEGKVYYSFCYYDVEIDFSTFDVSKPETLEYINEHAFTELYSYDINLEKETCIYSGQYINAGEFYEDKVLMFDSSLGKNQLYEMNLLTMDKKMITNEEGYDTSFYDDGNLIYVIKSDSDYEYKYYDRKTEEIKKIGTINNSDFLIIEAILDDKIYVLFTDKTTNEYCEGYINKKDFYNADFNKVQPLIYPNRY